MIDSETHKQQSNVDYEQERDRMEEQQKEFDFLKLEFMMDESIAVKRYKEEYKNDIGGIKSGQLSFHQWIECKKYDAAKFYVKHSDYYLGF